MTQNNRLMISKIIEENHSVLLYGIAGVTTTVVDVGLFYLFAQIIKLNYLMANILAYIIATMYAFWVIKIFVFKNLCMKLNVVLKELLYFFLTRAFTGVLDSGIMIVGIEYIRMSKMPVKCISILVTTIINFCVSKYKIFRK